MDLNPSARISDPQSTNHESSGMVRRDAAQANGGMTSQPGGKGRADAMPGGGVRHGSGLIGKPAIQPSATLQGDRRAASDISIIGASAIDTSASDIRAQAEKNAEYLSAYERGAAEAERLGVTAVPFQLDGRWYIAPRKGEGQLTDIECLLRAAECDGKSVSEALAIAGETPVFNMPADRTETEEALVRYWLTSAPVRAQCSAGGRAVGLHGAGQQAVEPDASIARYGQGQLLWHVQNIESDPRCLEFIEQQAANTDLAPKIIFDALNGSYDYVLLLRSAANGLSVKLIDAVDPSTGMVSSCEPRSAFRSVPFESLVGRPAVGADDDMSTWRLIGLRKNHEYLSAYDRAAAEAEQSGVTAVPFQLDGRWYIAPRKGEGRLSDIECMLRAAECEGKEISEASRIAAEDPVFNSHKRLAAYLWLKGANECAR